jgi:predicted permease
LVGSLIKVDGESLLVVGILPRSFRFPESTTSLWRPVDFSAPLPDLSVGSPAAYARFSGGRPRDTALAIATDRARAVDARLASQQEVKAQARPIAGASAREYLARIAPYLAGGVVLVFVVLCANVASLLLAQMTARSLEFRTCTALGASRRRLFRQSVTESAALGVLGMAGGVLLAWALVALARAFLPESFLLQSLNPVDVDLRALMAACATGFGATASAGVLPAWAGTRAHGTYSLAPGERTGTETRLARRATRTLLVVEIALGCTLLVGAGLLVRSFVNLSHIDRGLDTRNVITAWIQLALPEGAAEADRRAAADRLTAELHALPGVQAVTLSRGLPPDGSEIYFGNNWQTDVPGAPALNLMAHGYPVTQEFFDFYGIRRLAGRSFEPGDDRYKVLVSEEFAARLWPGENPVGRTYRHGNSQPNEVIGLVSEIRHPSLDPFDDLPEVYYRYAGGGSSVMVSLRCGSDCLDLPRLRRWLLEGPASNVIRLGVLDDAYLESLARPRAAAALSMTFATIAMVAASSGLFSVLTYAVGRRRREFGIRASLGARPVDLQVEIVREGVRLAVIGAIIGGSGAWLSTRWLQSLVYDVSRVDPATIASVLGIVVVTTLIAVWAPSRRAGRANPVELLREV